MTMNKNIFLRLMICSVAIVTLASCGDNADKRLRSYLENYMDYDLLPVHPNRNTSGYVNLEGDLVIEFDDYKHIYPFHDGLALTSFGFIDKEGEVVIETSDYRIDGSTGFSEGIALMYDERAKETVAIDKTGNEIFRTDGKALSRMYGGYALIRAERPIRTYIVDREGNTVFELEDPKNEHFPWSRSAARPSAFTIMSGEKLAYIIDLDSGKKYLEDFCDYKQGNHTPLIDWNNQIVLYDNEEDKYGVVDLDGRWVIEPQYSYMRCDGELYSVKDDDGNVGWVDKNGKVVIEPQFESCRWYYLVETTYAFNGSDLAYITAESCFINRKGERVYEDVPGYVESFGVKGRYILDDNKYQNWMTLPNYDLVPLEPSQNSTRAIFPEPNSFSFF